LGPTAANQSRTIGLLDMDFLQATKARLDPAKRRRILRK
jgi:hypothetical protein